MRLISLVYFLFFITCSFSQDVKIKFPVNNYIYAKIDNPIDIISCEDLDKFIITAKGAVLKKRWNTYSLRAKEAGVAYINIYNKKSKSTQSIPVRIRDFPTPTVFLDRELIDLPIKKKLQLSRRLRTHNFELGRNFFKHRKLVFDLTVIYSNKVYSFKDQENKFSKEIKSLFDVLEKDDLVIFYNIRFKADTEKKMLLNDLVYKID